MKTASKQSKVTQVTQVKPATALPTFSEIAKLRISEAGPRDKTITIKIAINTARMMVEQENRRANAYPELVAALREVVAVERGWESIEALLRKLGEAS